MGQNSHVSNPPLTQNQNNAMSDDPGDGHRLTDKPGPVGKTPVEKAPENDAQNQAKIEEFGERGMGVAAKE
ncbi:hypothetical protein ACUXST_001778 [Sphingomonas sp. F9_3S_D5_B_2]